MNSALYYQYIERLTSEHKFIKNSSSGKHFYRGELEEFYYDLRNKVNFPAVIAESFELDYSQNLEKVRETSFIVAGNYAGSKNWDSIYCVMDLCERVGDEFIRRMVSDSESGHFCGQIEPVSAIPVLNEQHLYVGIRFTIRISSRFEWEIDRQIWDTEIE